MARPISVKPRSMRSANASRRVGPRLGLRQFLHTRLCPRLGLRQLANLVRQLPDLFGQRLLALLQLARVDRALGLERIVVVEDVDQHCRLGGREGLPDLVFQLLACE